MGLVGTHARCPTPMVEGRGARRGKTGSLSGRTRSPPRSARGLSSLALSTTLPIVVSFDQRTATTLPSRTVSLRITDEARSLPRTSSTEGIRSIPKLESRARVSGDFNAGPNDHVLLLSFQFSSLFCKFFHLLKFYLFLNCNCKFALDDTEYNFKLSFWLYVQSNIPCPVTTRSRFSSIFSSIWKIKQDRLRFFYTLAIFRKYFVIYAIFFSFSFSSFVTTRPRSVSKSWLVRQQFIQTDCIRIDENRRIIKVYLSTNRLLNSSNRTNEGIHAPGSWSHRTIRFVQSRTRRNSRCPLAKTR